MKTILKLGEMMPYLPTTMKDAIAHIAKETGQDADGMELHRHAHSEKAKVNELDPTVRKSLAYVSTRTQDRDDEIVIPQAIVLKEFMKYGSVLVNHNYSLLPVGSDDWIVSDGYGIKALTSHADTGEGTLANVVWHLVSQGHLKGRSVGFVPTAYTKPGKKDWDHVANQLQSEWKEFDKGRAEKNVSRIITGGVLLEHSFVSVPCNTDAVQVIKGMGLEDVVMKQLGWDRTEDEDSGLALVFKSFVEFAAGGIDEMFPTMKPYPNEHAARITDPDKYKKFARQNGKGGEGVDFVFGVLPDGKTELQAVRFNKDKFTPEQAKAWIKEHDMKTLLFEEAKAEGKAVVIGKQEATKPVPCMCDECGAEGDCLPGDACKEENCKGKMQEKKSEKGDLPGHEFRGNQWTGGGGGSGDSSPKLDESGRLAMFATRNDTDKWVVLADGLHQRFDTKPEAMSVYEALLGPSGNIDDSGHGSLDVLKPNYEPKYVEDHTPDKITSVSDAPQVDLLRYSKLSSERLRERVSTAAREDRPASERYARAKESAGFFGEPSREKIRAIYLDKSVCSIRVLQPGSSIKVLYTPPDPQVVAKGVKEAVERALSRRTGKIL